jgi:hypothetical protein
MGGTLGSDPGSSASPDRINYVALAARVRRVEKWIDTIESPLWKRAWFVIQGYRFRRLGVWYRARWNRDGWDY